MSKKKIRKYEGGLVINTSSELREKIKQYYIEKFFNKFLDSFEFTGLSYQQISYIMRKFWDAKYGTVGAFRREVYDSAHPEEQIVFAPWILNGVYNIYDFPTGLTFVNTRGVSFIPDKPFEIDTDNGAVIGFIQRDKKGIYATIEAMVEKLVDFEMVIRTNLKAQKTPWIVGISPENEEKMKAIYDNLDSDDPKLFMSIEDLQNMKALVSGANYNIDKLETQRQQCENEILSRIGINNVGVMEKKEHFTVDEVNANNEQITSSSDEFVSCMSEFFERIDKYLHYKFTVKRKESSEIKYENKEDKKEEEYDE